MALTLLLLLPLLAAIALIAIPGESARRARHRPRRHGRHRACSPSSSWSGATRSTCRGSARSASAGTSASTASRPRSCCSRPCSRSRSSCTPWPAAIPAGRLRLDVPRLHPARRDRRARDLPRARRDPLLHRLRGRARADVGAHPQLRRRPRARRAAGRRGGPLRALHRARVDPHARRHPLPRAPPGHVRPHRARRPARRRPLALARGRPSPRCCCSASASRCRCGRCTRGCRRPTPSPRPPARCCSPRCCSRWAPTASCASSVATVPKGVAALSPVLAILGVGRHPLGRARLPRRARPQAPHRLQLGRAHGLRRARHRVGQRDRPAGGAARQHRPRHRRRPALLRRRRPQGAVGVGRPAHRPGRPARHGAALRRRALIGLAAALGLPGLVSFWGEFLALYAAWSPAADRPVALLRVCVVLGAVGLALAAAYSLRVARIVWSGEGEPVAAPRDAAAEPVARRPRAPGGPSS